MPAVGDDLNATATDRREPFVDGASRAALELGGSTTADLLGDIDGVSALA
jgi:hypothetical protein